MSDMDLAELLLEATEYPGWSSWCGDIIGRLAAALAESEEQGVLYRANQPPCDGGCNVNDGPAEECSAHGRPVADVWEIVNRARYEVGEQAATIARIHAMATEDTGMAWWVHQELARILTQTDAARA